jgi:hypothetical protein
VVGLAAIAANTPALDLSDQSGLPAFVTTGAYQRYLRAGETVVTLSTRGNAGLLWQASTDFYTREAGGYISEAISVDGGLPAPVADLAASGPTPANVRQFRAYLTRAGVGAVLVEASHAGPWPAVLADAGLRGRAAGGVIVYQVRLPVGGDVLRLGVFEQSLVRALAAEPGLLHPAERCRRV